MKIHEVKPYEISMPNNEEFLTLYNARSRFGGGRIQRVILRYTLIIPHCNDQVILDVGHGNGIGLSLISTVAKQIIGVDKNPNALKFAEGLTYYCPTKLIELNIKNILKVRKIVPKVGTSILCDILEHVTFPDKLLKDISSMTTDHIFGNIPVNCPGKYHVKTYSAEDIIDLVTSALGGHIVFSGIKGRTVMPLSKCLKDGRKINNVFFACHRDK
jgi:SAM-dependent methyltransferase